MFMRRTAKRAAWTRGHRRASAAGGEPVRCGETSAAGGFPAVGIWRTRRGVPPVEAPGVLPPGCVWRRLRVACPQGIERQEWKSKY